MRNHLLEILTSLAAAKIRFVLCGGVAVVLHGIERLTMDIDLCVSMDEDNLSKLITLMHELGMTPRVPVPPESLLDPEKRRIMLEEKNALVFTFIDVKNPYRQIDIFLGRDSLYPDLIEDAEYVELSGLQIPVISLGKLIRMKKEVNPPRDKDLSDIRELEKITGGRNEK